MIDAPITGAWRPGDHPGRREFASLFGGEHDRRGGLDLEAGGHLGEVTVAYETWGKLNASASNAVLVLHALSGDSHVSGPVEAGHASPGWWGPLVGPGAPIDTNRYFVVCPNVLGGCQGHDRSELLGERQKPYGSRFPVVTVKDQVAVECALAPELGIDTWYAMAGGSMGGMRAIAVGRRLSLTKYNGWSWWPRARPPVPSRSPSAGCRTRLSVSIRISGAATTTTQIAVRDRLGHCSGIGHLSYRSEIDLQQRFANNAQGHKTPLRRGSLCGRVLPRPPRRKADPPFRCQQLPRPQRGDEPLRPRPRLWRSRAALSRVQAQVTIAGISSTAFILCGSNGSWQKLLGTCGRCSGHRLDHRPRRVPRGAPRNKHLEN